MGRSGISETTMRRLARYLCVLTELNPAPDAYLTSRDLADRSGVSAAQVRKDLAFLGETGKQGVGYPAAALRARLAGVLRVQEPVPVVVVGADEAAVALARFLQDRAASDARFPFRMEGLFAVDRDDGTPAVAPPPGTMPVRRLTDLGSACASLPRAPLALLPLTGAAAQRGLDACAQAGIRAALGFAPDPLVVPPGMILRRADIFEALLQLAAHF